ncbi:hypothetical protein KM043_008384 [Ampulex compressa]|nr:hypothetical protein KM043_008384 [Ampulex compressa]
MAPVAVSSVASLVWKITSYTYSPQIQISKMVSSRVILTLLVVLVVLAMSAAAAYKKPPVNGSIFGKRNSIATEYEMTNRAMSMMCECTSSAARFCTSIEMMHRSRSVGRSPIFFNAFVIGLVTFLICQNNVEADEVPAFFLKIAKNIPRVGRSGKFEDFFYKSAKNIPRIGRSDGNAQPSEAWPSYEAEEAFMGPSKRRLDYGPINVQDAWSWQHFPLAIEGPRELWRTLAGYAKDTSDDIDNEVWQRKKRTGNEAINLEAN